MKLTPLNIALACILVWIISEWGTDQEQLMSWGWLIGLVVLISIIDIAFRVIFKDNKRIWFLQIGFMLLVGILMLLLKLQ